MLPLVTALVACLLLSGEVAFAQPAGAGNPFVPGEILVKFRTGVPAVTIDALNASAGAHTIRVFPTIGVHHLKTPLPVPDAVRLYQANPHVEYAEPNYIVRHTIAPQLTPNDPLFPELWGLHNTGQTGGTPDADIDAPEAWAIQTGSRSVVVAVIDSGIDYTHQDLSANMFRNLADCDSDGVDDDGNGFIDDCFGIDTFNGDSDPFDDDGHGSHVAGTIGAVGNNGLGVVGVNWAVSLMACKFLDAFGFGPTAGAIACLDYVKTMKDRGVNLVATSNSWGGGRFSFALKAAIEATGILFVAAAGNQGSDNDTVPHYPCSYTSPNIVCVTSTTHTDAKSPFSNFGATSVDLGAPGSRILSTVPFDGYQFFSGTSMATPHVAGTAALLSSHFPGITPAAAKCRILAGVDPIAALAGITVTGGRLNAFQALTTTACDGAGVIDVAGNVAIGGASLVAAKVTLTNKATGARASTITGATGGYQFDPVAPGTYRILIRPLVVSGTTTVSGNLRVKEMPSVGTKVRLKNVDTGVSTSTFTDASGNFSFAGVPAGRYRLIIPTVTVP